MHRDIRKSFDNIDLEKMKITFGGTWFTAFLVFFGIGSAVSVTLKLIFEGDVIVTFLIGFSLWGTMYFFIWFDKFWINPDANTMVVLQNYLQTGTIENSNIINSLEIPKGQRVVSTGISPKGFFEKPVGEPIKVERKEVTFSVVVRDENEAPFTVKGRYFTMPIRGIFATRYPLITDKVAEEFFTGIFTRHLEGVFPDQDGDDILKKLEDSKGSFAEGLENLFRGDDIASDDEKRYARTVHDIAIVSIDKDKAMQDAAQATKIAKDTGAAIAELVARGVTPDVAAGVVVSNYADTDMRFITVSGAPNITGGINLGPSITDDNKSNTKKAKGPK